MPYLGAAMEPGQDLIRVSPAERDWLYAERTRAMKTCHHLDFQRDYRNPKIPFNWLCALRIHRRAKDGCLEAAVVLALKDSRHRYVRLLRTPASLASSEGPRLWLRRSASRG